MLLALDIGNTNLVFGINQNDTWTTNLRIETHPIKPVEYYTHQLGEFLLENDFLPEDIDKVVMSSVVTELTTGMQDALGQFFNKRIVLVGPDIYDKMDVETDRPYQIGSDLVANAAAAFDRYKSQSIIMDFGTALTFTTVNDQGLILGVAIAPGIKTAMKALAGNTSKLPEVPLELPKSVLGRDTVHAIQAGILWGYVGLVEYQLQKIKDEVGEAKILATGGLSFVLEPIHSKIDYLDTNLTMNGMKVICEQVLSRS